MGTTFNHKFTPGDQVVVDPDDPNAYNDNLTVGFAGIINRLKLVEGSLCAVVGRRNGDSVTVPVHDLTLKAGSPSDREPVPA